MSSYWKWTLAQSFLGALYCLGGCAVLDGTAFQKTGIFLIALGAAISVRPIPEVLLRERK